MSVSVRARPAVVVPNNKVYRFDRPSWISYDIKVAREQHACVTPPAIDDPLCGHSTMPKDSSHRIAIAADPANPGYYRWTIFRDGAPLDLPGYAYASAWSAEEAARVALEWHLILEPSRTQPGLQGCPTPAIVAAPAERPPERAAATATAFRPAAEA